MKNITVLSVLFLLVFSVSLYSLTAKRLYFTTNTLSSGTSVKPGFNFEYIWNGIGQARNGKIYVAISNRSESEGGGDVCVVEYNPYTNRMRNAGTVIEAYKAAGNWVSGEYCNKVHTWICGTPDGKAWMGTEDGGRGGHLLYVDPADGKLKDYSRTQKYIYLYSNQLFPVLNHPEQPPSNSNGIAVQDYSLKTMAVNPYAPQYIWTESYNNYYFQAWDVQNDTTRAFPGGHRDLRCLVVDKNGCLWFSPNYTVVKRCFDGTAKICGKNLGYTPSAYVYSHSYDSAFTTHRGDGTIEFYDFTRDTVLSLVDMPDGSPTNKAYRSITISRDGKKLYILGGSGRIYELTIATRQYRQIGEISSYLGSSYAFSSGTMDTLGNWYIATWGSGNSWLAQVNLGKGNITALPFPDVAVETRPEVITTGTLIKVIPNPFRTGTSIHLSSSLFGRADSKINIFDMQGRLVYHADLGESDKELNWHAGNLGSGVYLLKVVYGAQTANKRLVLMK